MFSRRRFYPLARWYGCHFGHRGSQRLLTLIHPIGSAAATHGSLAVVPFDNGLQLEVETANWVGWVIYFRGAYRPKALAAVRLYVRPGAIALDVGASLGDFTVVMATAVGREGSVHAFEPWPAEAARCRRNVELNQLTNVTVVARPVSDSPEPVRVRGSTGFNQSAASFAPPATIETNSEIVCKPILIDEYVRSLGRIDFMKVDSQGADLKVLRGASETLLEWHPTLLLNSVSEAHYRAQGASVAEIASFLASHGYRINWLDASFPVPKVAGEAFDSRFVGILLAVAQ